MYRGIKMKEQLEKIYSDAVADIEKAATVKDLEDIKFKYLSRKGEFNEIKKLYYDTGDTTLFNTISFIILDENKRTIESLTFPSYVLDDILNIVCDEREYSVVTYNLPLNSMQFKYEITFLVKEKYLILRKYNFLNKSLSNKFYIKFDNIYSE